MYIYDKRGDNLALALIIAEYNPFHKGHEYQLLKTKEVASDGVIVVMSGNFVQRAEGAVLPKKERAKAAILSGADLVIELPSVYASATAQKFALGAVSIAEAIGCVDMLSMGSELGSIEPIIKTASLLNNMNLESYLIKGNTFAKARQLYFDDNHPELSEILKTPNNTLAVEYCRAIEEIKSKIKPCTVKRVSVSHDDDKAVDGFASASYIRELWRNDNLEAISSLVPEKAFDIYKQRQAFDYGMFEEMSLFMLRTKSLEDISLLPDISEGLEHRVVSAIDESLSYRELIEKMKTKRYTMARMRRVLLSAVLGITKEHTEASPPYIRILGIGEKGGEILSKMKLTAKLPFSHSLSQLEKTSKTAYEFAKIESRATDLYNLATSPRKGRGEEYKYRIDR